jgi:hypothetical protein
MFKYADRFRGVQNSISVFGFFCVSVIVLAVTSVKSSLSFPTRASGADWIVVICLCLIAPADCHLVWIGSGKVDAGSSLDYAA